ncbi:MAG TPA: CAP domain-containing protein, partial [Gemmatimonadales bacterium]|nr:CAP domain-containing protein [Gemmatimonadales bacterium]
LPRGHTIQVELKRSARDMDGNRLSIRWRFETKAPRVAPAAAGTSAPPSGPAPRTGGSNAPAGTLEYALWLINQSRADYGFGPLRLDSAISQVAADHAWDQIRYNYFSHTGRDGSRVSDRLRRAGISFGWSGENMCYYNGMGVRAMLDWCHRTFMSEPYPGVANHIGNILSGHYTRVGVGIAQSGGKVIIVWDFAG